MLFSGYVLSVLWGWFLVPLLGLPEITISGAIGIAIIVGYLTHQTQPTEDESFRDRMFEAIGMAIFKPTFVLFIGWLVTFWM
jgi:hypothetical protein